MKPVIVPTSDVNSETAIVTSWRVPDGAHVNAGDPIAEVETSKAVLEVMAPEAGHLQHAKAAGAEFRLAEPLGYVFASAEALQEYAARPPAANGDVRVNATVPAVRRAAELGVDIAALQAEGLITVKLVEAAAALPPDLPQPLEVPPGTQRIVLIGAGLGATQVLDILAGGEARAVAIVDDDRARWADSVAGVPVVGGQERLRELHAARAFDAAVITISTSVAARAHLRGRCEELGLPLTNAIHPTAQLCTGVSLGAGNVVCAFCHLGVETQLGDNNFLSAYNSFDHHNVLGNDISTGPGCMTSGLVTVGDRARLGTGVFVEPHVDLGAGVQVASGAVIVASVPAGHAVKRRVFTTAVVPIRG